MDSTSVDSTCCGYRWSAGLLHFIEGIWASSSFGICRKSWDQSSIGTGWWLDIVFHPFPTHLPFLDECGTWGWNETKVTLLITFKIIRDFVHVDYIKQKKEKKREENFFDIEFKNKQGNTWQMINSWCSKYISKFYYDMFVDLRLDIMCALDGSAGCFYFWLLHSTELLKSQQGQC